MYFYYCTIAGSTFWHWHLEKSSSTSFGISKITVFDIILLPLCKYDLDKFWIAVLLRLQSGLNWMVIISLYITITRYMQLSYNNSHLKKTRYPAKFKFKFNSIKFVDAFYIHYNIKILKSALYFTWSYVYLSKRYNLYVYLRCSIF